MPEGGILSVKAWDFDGAHIYKGLGWYNSETGKTIDEE